MGFRVGGNTAKLEFEHGSMLDGATVRVKLDMEVRDFLELQRTVAALSDADDTDAMDRMEKAFRQFASSSLVSWNLTKGDEDEPIPATEDGFLSLPFNAANAIFSTWATALGAPSPNSSSASLNGSTSAEAQSVATEV